LYPDRVKTRDELPAVEIIGLTPKFVVIAVTTGGEYENGNSYGKTDRPPLLSSLKYLNNVDVS